MINVAFGYEIAGEFVIRGEGTIDGVVGVDERDERGKIALRAAFTQQECASPGEVFRGLPLNRWTHGRRRTPPGRTH